MVLTSELPFPPLKIVLKLGDGVAHDETAPAPDEPEPEPSEAQSTVAALSALGAEPPPPPLDKPKSPNEGKLGASAGCSHTLTP